MIDLQRDLAIAFNDFLLNSVPAEDLQSCVMSFILYERYLDFFV